MAVYVFNQVDDQAANQLQSDAETVTARVVPPRVANVLLTEMPIAGQPGARNQTQSQAITRLPDKRRLKPIYQDATSTILNEMFGPELDWAYRCYQVTPQNMRKVDGQPVFPNYIYLFNVLVAFEWAPSKHNIAMLERAARRAADFLFDVTNGWMTFGQIVIGGPELLDCADIQVMASNRLLARSWVGGLHEPEKYMPIRLGRGHWQKNTRGSIPWDEPEGYRTLVHEWAHYALELLDDYVDRHEVYIAMDADATSDPLSAQRSTMTVLVPSVSQPAESIMSTLEGTSELMAARGANIAKRKQAEWDILSHGFEGVNGKQIARFPRIPAFESPEYAEIEGPLPLTDLPHVVWLDTKASQDAQPIQWAHELVLDRSAISPVINIEHCWVYVLKKNPKQGLLDGLRQWVSGSRSPLPARILAQGTLDRLVGDGFRLFGAAAGDDLVLIGNDIQWNPRVLRATIAGDALVPGKHDRQRIVNLTWHDVTPSPFPIISVHPEAVLSAQGAEQRAVAVRVQVRTPDGRALYGGAGLEAHIFPLDHVVSNHMKETPISVFNNTATVDPIGLDGHVFVEIADKLVIATYSQGGGPPTGSPTGGTPITPGSSEGNLMVFFDDLDEYPDINNYHRMIRVITTRWAGGGESPLPHSKAEARGYAYSLCANEILPIEYRPTMALSYDKRTELKGGEAIVHRLDDTGNWQPILSYRPNGAWYVAAPLTIQTAPRLFDPKITDNSQRVEHFRLFWMPPAA
jgi:hypothetical protein